MRRVALGFVGSGVVLLGSGALGLLASWSTVAAVLLLASGAVLLAIVMEEADLREPHLREPQRLPVIAALSTLQGSDLTS